MGANVGTSITSTFVSLTQVGDKENFRRGFAAATVHDVFNLLSVAVLLPIEIASGYLYYFSDWFVGVLIPDGQSSVKEPQILSVITKPLTTLIIQLDSNVVNNLANKSYENMSLIKHKCGGAKCEFLFEGLEWEEWAIGLLLLVISLGILIACLVFLVKILGSIFQGPVAKILTKVVNSDFPGYAKYLTDYVAILVRRL